MIISIRTPAPFVIEKPFLDPITTKPDQAIGMKSSSFEFWFACGASITTKLLNI